MYIPALAAAREQFTLHKDHPNIALFLIFLSDGKPSDFMHYLHHHDHSQATIYQIELLARTFGKRLTICPVGFGDTESVKVNFDTLKGMADVAKNSGSNAFFQHSLTSSSSLSSVVSKLSSSLTATKTYVTSLAASRSKKTLRQVLRGGSAKVDRELEYPCKEDWHVYTVKTNELCKLKWGHTGKFRNNGTYINNWLEQPIDSNQVSGVAIQRRSFAEGAERLVFKLRWLDLKGRFVGTPMVAKECLFVEDEVQKVQFHKVFCQTQGQSKRLGEKFNRRLESVMKEYPKKFPLPVRVDFLDCYALTFFDELGIGCGVLVEKMLDWPRYQKWNTNNGEVGGKDVARAVHFQEPDMEESVEVGRAVRFQEPETVLPPLEEGLGVIVEEGSEDEEVESSNEEEEKAGDGQAERIQKEEPVSEAIKMEEIPQAFSHFSWHNSRRKKLVCDLQGVKSVLDDGSVLFEFTDPAIHYKSETRRRQVFGRTDHGEKGMKKFFDSHECKSLCKLFKLAKPCF